MQVLPLRMLCMLRTFEYGLVLRNQESSWKNSVEASNTPMRVTDRRHG